MEKLVELQKLIAEINIKYWDDPNVSRLLFSEVAGLYHIEFYGNGYDDNPNTALSEVDEEDNYTFIAVLEAIKEMSESISHLSFSGPDEGANGFRSWDFSRLINIGYTFKNLVSLKVELTDPGFHNLSCITPVINDYEEGGMVSRLLKSMPKIRELIIPSAPNSDFFDLTMSDLQYLRIEAGYSSQDFINNFGTSDGFTNLSVLDYSDVFFFADAEDRKKTATNFSEFKRLFESKAFTSVKHFTLRNSNLDVTELIQLQELRPDLQFLVISSLSGQYVSHLAK
ncbi:MAG: hypothetical protein MJK10_15370 [Pseudomonadales bacterium]|nr:hypothetical protein [Pseudomonadales bacterium]NRA17617.1 hypothetical protein [Oceanospirillaceae bacterium]